MLVCVKVFYFIFLPRIAPHWNWGQRGVQATLRSTGAVVQLQGETQYLNFDPPPHPLPHLSPRDFAQISNMFKTWRILHANSLRCVLCRQTEYLCGQSSENLEKRNFLESKLVPLCFTTNAQHC